MKRSMKRWKLSLGAMTLMLAVALVPSTGLTQEDDTLTISGVFHMVVQEGTVGDDLASVFAAGDPHAWTLTLYGVTTSHYHYYDFWDNEVSNGYDMGWITSVHATWFDFEFVGPDADVLNAAVSQQLVSGSLTDGAFLELLNGETYDSLDPMGGGLYSSWNLGLLPLDAGVSFYVSGSWLRSHLTTDVGGYPAVEPQRLAAFYSAIADQRPGNFGELGFYGDFVDIGNPEPPPPPPLTMSIANGSVREGNKGPSRLDLTVTLSRAATDVVTVNYRTVDGTALASSDYTTTSGTLTFQPGQSSKTIPISIKGDRKREPNEAFSVQLSNAVGATIGGAAATATILNDD